jgi:hypothetical protein
MKVGIAAKDVIMKSRQSLRKEDLLKCRREQLGGRNVAERLGKWQEPRTPASSEIPALESALQQHSWWTQEEFSQFWANISAYVKAGKAGWGIRVVKEVVDTNRSSNANSGDLQVQVKIFTWGEVVGHIWVLLWVLSDKLVSYIPMEWIAGDGLVVVRMTGDRYRQGTLGLWTRRGSTEGAGSWGIGCPLPQN